MSVDYEGSEVDVAPVKGLSALEAADLDRRAWDLVMQALETVRHSVGACEVYCSTVGACAVQVDYLMQDRAVRPARTCCKYLAFFSNPWSALLHAHTCAAGDQ